MEGMQATSNAITAREAQNDLAKHGTTDQFIRRL
jgi:hypothetical protein